MNASLNRANGFSGIGKFILDGNSDTLDYNIIDIDTPEFNLGSNEIKYNGANGSLAGDMENETSATLRFIVDEELEVYFSLYDIMKDNSINKTKNIFSLKVMNNKHKFIAQFIYEKCFISNIGKLNYSTTNEETTIFLDVTINFWKFIPQRID